MEPNRPRNRIDFMGRRNQAGITAIGFICLAAFCGFIGLACLKIAPLYMQKMRLEAVLNNMEKDMQGSGRNAQGIRLELESRLYVESLTIPRENVSIRQVQDGYQVHIQQENRTPFLADLWFVVMVDEQVEIRR